jgi:hypothetical protein
MNKKELQKSNNGKNYGWDINFESTVIAELTDFKKEDTFWDSYDLKFLESSHINEFKKNLYLKKFTIQNKKFNYQTWPEFLSTSLDDVLQKNTNRVFVRSLLVNRETIFYKIKKIFTKKSLDPYDFKIINYSSIPEIDNYYQITLNTQICFYSNIQLINEEETIIFDVPYVYYSPSIVDRKSEYITGMLIKGNIENINNKTKFRIER